MQANRNLTNSHIPLDKKEQIAVNSIRAWFLAARPKTLSGAAVPIMIGTALAFKDAGNAISAIPLALCFLFAFIMQIDANLINDYFDFKHGNDDETRLGPKRACTEGWITPSAMRHGIFLTTALACMAGLPLVYYGGTTMLAIGFACVVFCFLYTTTLSYLGLGDVLVLIFFGIVPVCLTYYLGLPSGSQTITLTVFLASVACGLVIETLLIVNNYRDIENDKQNGKKTLAVRIGHKNTEKLYLWCGIVAAYIMLIPFAIELFHTQKPLKGMIFLIAFLLYRIAHSKTYARMKACGQGKALNKILGETSRNMLLFGLTQTIALLIAATA